MNRSKFLLGFALCCASAVCAGTAIAQSTTEGAIAATVEDASGAVVPGATITIHNNGTNADKVLKSDKSGYFKEPLLEPGVYSVTVTATGFGAFKATAVTVQVGQLTTLEPHLTSGSASEVVEVTADTPQLTLRALTFPPWFPAPPSTISPSQTVAGRRLH